MTEEFETVRDYNRTFPSKLYVCPNCGRTTPNPYRCINCNIQSNGLFIESYQYTIKETGETNTIFKPIELEKGCNNDNEQSRYSK